MKEQPHLSRVLLQLELFVFTFLAYSLCRWEQWLLVCICSQIRAPLHDLPRPLEFGPLYELKTTDSKKITCKNTNFTPIITTYHVGAILGISNSFRQLNTNRKRLLMSYYTWFLERPKNESGITNDFSELIWHILS